MKDFKKLADKKVVEDTITALKKNNIDAYFFESTSKAKKKVLELIPSESRVLTSSSITLETIGLADEINSSKDFVSVKKEYMTFDHKTEGNKIRAARSIPNVMIGSVHAVTKNGEVLIASNTGSQLAGYVYGAGKVIWVVGTQKIVENLDEGFKRVYDYVLPLENIHMQGLYGINTNVSKLLIFKKEIAKNRVSLIFVNEILGF